MLDRLGEIPYPDKAFPDGSTELYEIRTHRDRRRTSLILLAECESVVTAIFIARNFIRQGEGAEIWREDRIVYRLLPRWHEDARVKNAAR